MKVADGGKPAVDHYCIAAERFDYEVAVKNLAAVNVKAGPSEIAGSPEFRDPDGYRIQAVAAR